MNALLILHAGHEFNASTFGARVCSTTLSDIYSAFTAAIASLRGPLHGGSNEAAIDLIMLYKIPDEAIAWIKRQLANK